MKKVLFFLVTSIIGIIVFGLVIDIIGWGNVAQSFSLFREWGGIAILAVTVLSVVVSILRWKFILKVQGYNVSKYKLADVWLLSFAVTYLTPITILGGEGLRAYALKKKFPIPWGKNIASIIIDRFLDISMFFLFFIGGIFSFLILVGLPPENVGLIFAVIIVILGIMLGIFYFKSFRKESILKWFLKPFGIRKGKNGRVFFDTEKEVFRFFEPNKRFMWQGLLLTFLRYFLILTRCWLIIFFLRGGISILIPSAAFSFVSLASLFPLPAALGSLEASQAFAFGFLGLGANMGIAFSLILRGAELLVCLVGIIFLIKLGIKSMETKITEKIGKLE